MTMFMKGHAVRWDLLDAVEAWDIDVLAAFGKLEGVREDLEQRSKDRGWGYVGIEPVDDGSGDTRPMLVCHYRDTSHDHPHRIRADALVDAEAGAWLASTFGMLPGRER